MIMLCIEMHILQQIWTHILYMILYGHRGLSLFSVVTEVFSLISGTLYSVDQRTRNLEPGDLKVHTLYIQVFLIAGLEYQLELWNRVCKRLTMEFLNYMYTPGREKIVPRNLI